MKKNKTILIVSLSVIGAIVIGIRGFAMERKIIESVSDAIDLSYESRDKRIEKECRKHLKEKYGDFDYQVSGVSPRDGVLQKYDDMIAYVIDREGCKREFRVTIGGNANKPADDIEDNYYQLMVANEYEDMVKPIAEKYLGSCKVYYYGNTSPLDNSINKDTPLNEVLNLHILKPAIKIVVNNDITDFEKHSYEFIDEWKTKGWETDISIYKIGSNYDFNTITKDTFEKMIGNNEYSKEVSQDIKF